VRRDGTDPAALRAALKVLQEGRVLLVFPEGTRGEEGKLRPAKPGAGMLAVLSGAPVIPVYISGSGRAWPRGRRWPRPAKVTVTFGPPLRFSAVGAPRKELYEAASREMMAAIARLKDAAPAHPASASPRERGTAAGEVGVGGASTSPHYIHGRNGQHGEG
jgi:1-acyl-sn-glycerol-3-phosphate acyltransferase